MYSFEEKILGAVSVLIGVLLGYGLCLVINQPITEVVVVEHTFECQEEYNLQSIQSAEALCVINGGALTSYRISEWLEDITVSITCEVSK